MRSALRRAGTALAGALLATSVVSAPAHAEPAALSGTITSATTGLPVPGCAMVYDSDWNWGGSYCTDASGQWTVDGLTAGRSYKVEISSQDDVHIGEWAQNASSFETATTFVAPATVDVALSPGGILAGTLTMADGDPVPANAAVSIHNSSGEQVAYATPTNGDWRALVAPGTYRVEFSAPPVEQWAFGTSTMEEAAPVTAVAGQTTRVDDTLPGIDETTFAGTLTATDTGEPLDGCVTAYTADTGEYRASACTGEDGSGKPGYWTMTTLTAGTQFKFQFSAWDGAHASEWGLDSGSFERAATYVGPATIDVGLERGTTMTGSLTTSTGEPAMGTVTIHDVDDEYALTTAWPSDDGTWSALLRPGSYAVEFAYGNVQQWAIGSPDRAGARVYSVAGGDTVSVDDRLPGLGSVSGTITSDVDGSPVNGACVSIVRSPVNPDDATSYGEGCTDDTGHYSVKVSGQGTFTAEIHDPSGRFAGEYHGNTRVPGDAASFDLGDHTAVTVDAGLGVGATVTGLAVDAKLGTPVANMCPAPYDGNWGANVRWTTIECTGADGRWTVRGLPAGSFAFEVGGDRHSDYVPTWTFKATSQATAELTSVKAGETKSIRETRLMPGGTLTGVITDPFGKPVVGAFVDAQGIFPGRAGPGEGRYVAQTDGEGRYRIGGLPAGDFRPLVYAGDFVAFAPEWSGDADSFDTATPITVKSAKTSTFSAEVGPGARFTGEVVRTDGTAPPPFLDGDVQDLQGRIVGNLDWDGTALRTTALPAGSYQLVFHDYGAGKHYWYDGMLSRTGATTLSVARGEQRAITFHIPPASPSDAG